VKIANGGRKVLAGSLALAFVAAGNLFPQALAAEPGLKLFAPKSSVTIKRSPNQPVIIDPGAYITAEDGPFELRIARTDYDTPPAISQYVYTDAGVEVRPLPAEVLEGWVGLAEFTDVEVRRANGTTVTSWSASFCPNAWERQRVNDSGPVEARYPFYCPTNPFTKSAVWGIDEGWASALFGYDSPAVKVKDGVYDVTVAVDSRYIELFNIAPEDSTVTVSVEIKTAKCRHHCDGGIPIGGPGVNDNSQRASGTATESIPVPNMDSPDSSVLPDLVALPSWGIGTEHRRGRDWLTFGSTVWTGGASPLVVEGFRRPESDIMDGYQYFYKDGEPVGRDQVGTLEYDTRRGHQHWHFKQFAAYQLLDADQSVVVKSGKEAFCLAPTDAIDLAVPGADWSPETGLQTACGQQTSIWVREILPIGWGDTYFQGLPGQSFDITDLPNGTYFIEVEANPGSLLHEQSFDNNIELREVILKGKPGKRRVEVPPWHGIDTEGGLPGGPFG
jgi:hypothetical protein